MKSDKLFKVLIILIFVLIILNIYSIFIHTPLVNAQQNYQKLSEIKVKSNVLNNIQAMIPEKYGELKGIEGVGKSTMLWFESEDGIIRRINLSFWEDEIILDDLVVTIERN